jgi:hypothetical protein
MEDFKKEDFILTRQGHIDVIKHLDKPNITLDGEEYNIDNVSPIPIDNARSIVLCPAILLASLIDNGIIRVEKSPEISFNPTRVLLDKMGLSLKSKNDKDKTGTYWLLSDISMDFLKENNIQYVHELQHYLQGKSLLWVKKHTNHSDL